MPQTEKAIVKQTYKIIEHRNREDSYMEHETKELFNAIINEMDRMQERIYNKIDSSIDAFKEENRQQHEQMIHEINAWIPSIYYSRKSSSLKMRSTF